MAKPHTFQNPVIASGADPWVVKYRGIYVYTHTTGTDIRVRTSAALSSIGTAPEKIVWAPPASGPTSRNIWAPELHYLEGRWYLYFAADDGDNKNHRMYVLESAGDDPLGPYAEKGKISDPSDRWAIDGTVLKKADGSMYWIWSGWEGTEDVSQQLYIAPMDTPYSVCGEGIELSRPEYDWETVGRPTVNEGPQVLLRGDDIFLVYSASGSWTDDYCLGMLRTKQSSNVLDPGSWIKSPKPVFSRCEGVFGPGHCSFTRSPDDTEDWILYHAAVHQGAGWNRSVRTQRFGWNEDGTPNFGSPIPPGVDIPVPSGE